MHTEYINPLALFEKKNQKKIRRCCIDSRSMCYMTLINS